MNYDFSGFHPNCSQRGLCISDDGVHVYCLDCGVSANLEAISAKVSAVDACKVGKDVNRQPIGKQTAGISKGVLTI